VYSLHVATNTVREIYPALAIADHLSFRVDEYAGLHPDLFEKPGYGWHINSNPGASMIAAAPYAAAKPLVDRVVASVNRRRAGQQVPEYNSPWPMARQFFQESWRRGLDVKFGLAAIIMQTLCMAHLSDMAVVTMFFVLLRMFASDRMALWLALVYAFGTPLFFRTGYLNHNVMVGHCALLGFIALWTSSSSRHLIRYFLAGIAGGTAVLLDYTGVIIWFALFLYGAVLARRPGRFAFVKPAALYVAGSIGPVALLCFYQWKSFGNPLFPAQHWMPRVAYIDVGYQGMALPMPDLLIANAFDYRYGLFTSCPLLLLAFAAPFLRRLSITRRELWFFLSTFVAFWLFASAISYARLQFNTGVRYMTAVLPFVFVCAAAVLVCVPRRMAYMLAVAAVAQAWCMAMYRDVERGFGVFESVLHVFIGGFQLPLLTVFSRMTQQFGEYTAQGASPLPLFAVTAALLYGVWALPLRGRKT
jgi:hypothetical protein